MDVKTRKCGFFVCKSKPFLGASPDALVGEDALVEMKCPYSGQDGNVQPGKNFNFLTYDKNGNIVLKPTSNYYYQIQGQLFICEKTSCYFVVYTFKDLFVQRIDLDAEYCIGSLIPKLELFYTKHFKPFVANSL